MTAHVIQLRLGLYRVCFGGMPGSFGVRNIRAGNSGDGTGQHHRHSFAHDHPDDVATVGSSDTPGTNARASGRRVIPEPIGTLTHAVTIRRPTREVWPWLVPMGAGSRAG
jgi:hypothetical protein